MEVAKRTAAAPVLVRGGSAGEARSHPFREQALLEPVDLVDELHHGGDRGVELEAGIDVPGDLVDRPVGLREQLSGLAVRPVDAATPIGPLGDLPAEAPEPGEEPEDPLDALVRPVPALDRRPHEADVGSQRVRPEAVDVLSRIDGVAAGLGHLRPVAGDHSLGEQVGERLLRFEQVHVVQRLDEEARVHQVQDRVLDPADVLVDRHPVVGDLSRPRLLVIAVVQVAEEVPGGIDEGVHRVRLATGLAAA